MPNIYSLDASTGQTIASYPASAPADVEAACRRAAEAADWLSTMDRQSRARLLERLAVSLERDADRLIALCDRETALGPARLRTELARTAYQLRFLGAVAAEGGYLGASIETPGSTPFGPTPDLRLTSVPLGPVAVFGASNFPLAFGAPGGDTASALAAGCPVVVKAHSSHPGTSFLVDELFARALDEYGAPGGVFQVIAGREAGRALVLDPRISAVGFTGSLAGGRALFDLAASRENPIPFYGELGSVNPLVVTEAAARDRGRVIGEGLAESMTLGTGQFCTKPGIVLVPDSAAGREVRDALAARVADVEPHVMLNQSIASEFLTGTGALLGQSHVRPVYAGAHRDLAVAPVVVEVDAEQLRGDSVEDLTREYFGPFSLVVGYSSIAELRSILAAFPPALTGTVHSAGDSDPDLAEVAEMLAERSGRVIFDQYPTGVAVAWSMHHGGQYPSSTSAATSVGANAIRRWLRPVAFQNAPQSVLPAELRDGPVSVPRRVNGQLTLPEQG